MTDESYNAAATAMWAQIAWHARADLLLQLLCIDLQTLAGRAQGAVQALDRKVDNLAVDVDTMRKSREFRGLWAGRS